MQEVSLIKLINGKIIYKVSRLVPEHYVAETKFFNTFKEALDQFNYWSN